MRIAILSPFYHPVKGGVEWTVKKIAEYLVTRGVEVYVVTYNRDRFKANLYEEEEKINGVNVIRARPNFMWSHGTYSKEIPGLVKKINPDIVHVNVWRHPYVFQVKNFPGIRVLQPHSPFYERSQVGVISSIYYTLIDSFMKNILINYNIIAITPFEKELLKRRFRVESTVIPPMVDPELFDETPGPSSFYLYLGRISKEKNIMTLLKAFKASNVSEPLVLAGPDGGMLHKVLKYVQKYKLNVKYDGEVDETRKFSLLKGCKALINPSPFEGFGLTLVEAEAFGKPTIIVGRGGQEFAAPPGITSIRAENSVSSISEAIRKMENDEVYANLSKRSREWARKFSSSLVLPQYLSYYRKLMEDNQKKSL
ncbi:glycosyltransferase family 4 protein [Acidianus sp. RZ1]|uniref:glycosyltransferase family 4 protein n=1 Tax=Acidianus sp. RZ1 TaxID=1540082 RepID=UPI00149284E5|nr:glycosyltransferase family 4 protein [Acidianus sp. RZ1]NON63501.1 glycosyltransferase family 4 protein [Acidianus sp. RZ1]